MIRRPPRSTLFPTRRSSDLELRGVDALALTPGSDDVDVRVSQLGAAERSEEHTSELQSRGDLVCGLLLEKKKNDYQSIRQKSNDVKSPKCCKRHIKTESGHP